jgi:two-component system C4-dicarboxylate transport response regulator DctD
MTDAPSRIALIEDDEDLRVSTAQWLTLAGFAVDVYAAAAPALATIDADYPGVVITDVRMPQMSGIELFRALRHRDADLPVILITGHGDVAMAVDALQAGAWDFITKPFDPEALAAAATRASTARALALDNRRLRALADQADSAALVGQSSAIRHLREIIPVLAQSDLDLFIEGETGTGKALLARTIHRAGPRGRHRFLTIACAALPEPLEGELFAATGEASLTAAQRGTVLLDDIDLASASLQARLIPVLEDRALRPAGGRFPIPIDMRVIATGSEGGHHVPTGMAPALFYRLAAMRLRLPPLRERREDIPLLFAHLTTQAAERLNLPLPAITAPVRERLLRHDWPGNVRELAHFATRFAQGLEENAGPAHPALPLGDRVDAFERDAIVEAFIATGGDAGAAMQRLGLPRKTFYYKVARHRIDLDALRQSLRANGRRG